jgi:hypothetical protein
MKLSIDHHNCFQTQVVQTIDFRDLTPAQFKKVHNSAETGCIIGDGYVAKILKHVAGKYGLNHPAIISRYSEMAFVKHDLFNFYSEIVKELIDLSDVRQKFYDLADPVCWRDHYERRSGNHGRDLALYGWQCASLTLLRKEVLERLGTIPEFHQHNKQLADIIADKPVLETFRRTYR